MNLHDNLNKWALTTKKLQINSAMLKDLKGSSYVARENAKHISAYTFIYDVNGIKVSGFLVVPKKQNKKLPMIIFNRGGTADFDLVPEERLFTRLAFMARWGYVIVGTQYPGNKLSEGNDERGGQSDLESVLKFYELAQEAESIDETNIGMCGFSRGGMMTYLSMKSVNWIKAAVTIGGLSDLDSSLRFRPEMRQVLEESFKNTQKARDNRSVIKWVDELNKTPLCILHGSDDTKVDVGDSIKLAEKLEATKHPYSLHIIKEGDHGLTNKWEVRDFIIKNWFKEHLA